MESLERVSKSTFWIRDNVSRIIFWLCLRDITKECRVRCGIFIKGKFTRFTKKQRVPTDMAEFEMIKKKADKVRSRSYLSRLQYSV